MLLLTLIVCLAGSAPSCPRPLAPYYAWEGANSQYVTEITNTGCVVTARVDVAGPRSWLICRVESRPSGVYVDVWQVNTGYRLIPEGYAASLYWASWDDVLASDDFAAELARGTLARVRAAGPPWCPPWSMGFGL